MTQRQERKPYAKLKSKTNQSGASGLEYGMIVGLVSVLAIGAVYGVGTQVSSVFDTVASQTALDQPEKDPVYLGLNFFGGRTLDQMPENTSRAFTQETFLTQREVALGAVVVGVQAQAGTLSQNADTWIYTPNQHFSGQDTLSVSVQFPTKEGQANTTGDVFQPISPVATQPTLSAAVTEGAAPQRLTNANFSTLSGGVTFDPTTQAHQAPGDGASAGYYNVSSVTGTSGDDTFILSSVNGNYTIQGGGGNDTLVFPNFKSNEVTIDGRTRTITTPGGTITYSDIYDFDFEKSTFDGSPHGVKFRASSSGAIKIDTWLFSGRNLTGYPLDDQKDSYKMAFFDLTGQWDENFDIEVEAVLDGDSRYANGDERKKNAFIYFDTDPQTVRGDYKLASIRGENGNVSIEGSGGERYILSNENIPSNITYDLRVRGRENTAIFDIALKGNPLLEKGRRSYPQKLDGSIFGVGRDDSLTQFFLKTSPSNWAPYSPDIEHTMRRTDGQTTLTNVLANVEDGDDTTFTLERVDTTSQKGGRVEFSGQDILYTPKPGFVGTDRFSFFFSDGVNTASAMAIVDVEDENYTLLEKTQSFVIEATTELSDPDEVLEVEVRDLPAGVFLTDGTNRIQGRGDGTSIDITSWNLDNVTIENEQSTALLFTLAARAIEGQSRSDWVTQEIGIGYTD